MSPRTPLCSAFFFLRVMALDISKWKIVHVHYSLMVGTCILYKHVLYNIVVIVITPLMTFRGVWVTVKGRRYTTLLK